MDHRYAGVVDTVLIIEVKGMVVGGRMGVCDI